MALAIHESPSKLTSSAASGVGCSREAAGYRTRAAQVRQSPPMLHLPFRITRCNAGKNDYLKGRQPRLSEFASYCHGHPCPNLMFFLHITAERKIPPLSVKRSHEKNLLLLRQTRLQGTNREDCSWIRRERAFVRSDPDILTRLPWLRLSRRAKIAGPAWQ